MGTISMMVRHLPLVVCFLIQMAFSASESKPELSVKPSMLSVGTFRNTNKPENALCPECSGKRPKNRACDQDFLKLRHCPHDFHKFFGDWELGHYYRPWGSQNVNVTRFEARCEALTELYNNPLGWKYKPKDISPKTVRAEDQWYGKRLNDHMFAVIQKGDNKGQLDPFMIHCKWQICVHNEFPKADEILQLATSNNEDVLGEYKQTQAAHNKICMDKDTELASLHVTKVSSSDSYDIPVQDKPSSYDIIPVQDKPSHVLERLSEL